MRKVFLIVVLIATSSAIFTQDDEQLEVKGNVLFKDRVTSLNPPCLLYTSPSPRDVEESRMPSSA